MDAIKHDNGKARWDLIPMREVEQGIKVLTFGAKKYGPNQWQGLEDGTNRYFAALMRHLCAWRAGELIDAESGLPHLAHALCCLWFMMWTDNQGGTK